MRSRHADGAVAVDEGGIAANEGAVGAGGVGAVIAAGGFGRGSGTVCAAATSTAATKTMRAQTRFTGLESGGIAAFWSLIVQPR
jgi:hypothetical protein